MIRNVLQILNVPWLTQYEYFNKNDTLSSSVYLYKLNHGIYYPMRAKHNYLMCHCCTRSVASRVYNRNRPHRSRILPQARMSQVGRYLEKSLSELLLISSDN
ncbi:hypothetical protein BDB01DRAFT_839484 [Pilobolus umbonatus]|nr:hypothetical protein BDB01DRAFT_839484 [Pilobolus umbonatus]